MSKELLPLGIHFDLNEEVYHRDPGLGSTDMRKLLINPSDYWYESPMNPRRPREHKTEAKIIGHAMHKLVFEGEVKFHELYMRGADHDDDMTRAEKAAATKAANAAAARYNKTAIPGEDYDRIRIAGKMISVNPKLATAFQGGASEVSVIWERDGVRRKARIDYLKARGLGDLKSIENFRGYPFKQACRYAISNYRYDIQAVHYMEARRYMPGMIAEGMIHGTYDKALIKAVAETKQFGWQWVFFSKSGAPITWSASLSPQNPMCQYAARDIDTAVKNYQTYLGRFGANEMWLLIEDPEELSLDDMPRNFGVVTV